MRNNNNNPQRIPKQNPKETPKEFQRNSKGNPKENPQEKPKESHAKSTQNPRENHAEYPLQNPLKRSLKRVTDILLSTSALIIFPAILLPIALLIKTTSKGPVFYRQIRSGKNGRLFTCYKFRTMYTNSPDVNITKHDPRITPVGHVLRKTSLDELPQIINVFLGQMSIVGPRPHMVTHTLYYQSIIDDYTDRLRVKPGITGLAQIKGYRGTVDRPYKMAQRIKIDNSYIQNWTYTIDLKIIARTILLLIKGDKNAS